MTTAPLLIEIGTEEMPPLKLQSFASAWHASFETSLNNAELTFSKIQTFVTPRRLAIFIVDLADTQPDQKIERKGPQVKAAFDAAGNPTPATQGFLRGLNITLADCTHQETPKGTFLFYEATQPGRTLAALLQEIVEKAIADLPIPKPMRWGNHAYSFVRPVHWLLALHGEQVLPLSLFGKIANRHTYGHRFHAPEEITLHTATDYEAALHEKFVIADFQKRQKNIVSQIHALASMRCATPVIDTHVLEEVTGLVEWPVALSASFDPAFLKLPKEIPICSMQTHQRYFPLQNKKGDLIEHFILISNTESTMPEVIKQGNERVVRARLSDAAYFYEHDLKSPLDAHFDALSQVVFQNQLGHYQEKMLRVTAIATALAKSHHLSEEMVARACHLAKCDLLTQMVGEFPELQGTMGYHYALAQKEPTEIAKAIAEHYLPRFASDTLPKSMLGSILAIADRLDTLVGIFGVGLLPTGTKDPYALRRQAIAIIRLCVEKQLDFTVSSLLSLAANQYGNLVQKTHLEKIHPFFQERLKVWMQETYGFSGDLLDAVIAIQPDQPLDILHRTEALKHFKQLPEAPHLAAAHKRVHNILAKNTVPTDASIQSSLFESTAEKNLYEQMQKLDLKNLDYAKTLQQLATLQKPVDTFFEEVMVIAEDLQIRNNRLALLKKLHQLFSTVADLSLLQS